MYYLLFYFSTSPIAFRLPPYGEGRVERPLLYCKIQHREPDDSGKQNL